MYHRYMPSANGQYRRQAVPERKPPQNAAEQKPTPPKPAPCPPPSQERKQTQERKQPQEAPAKVCGGVQESRRNPLSALFGGLFKGFDSGDLLLLALLLLLLTEGSEDAAPMVLTLAIALML